LTPCPIAFAPDLTALDREAVETVDWSDEHDDLVDDLVDDLADDFVDKGGIRRVKKDVVFYSLLNSEARSR
jgi:hypothetical protein